MEAVSAAASILAIAGAGFSISIKLITFTDQVSTATKRIRAVGTDVSVTAGTLQQLGELMKKPSKKNSTGMFWPDQVRNIEASSVECKEIFDQLEGIFGKANQQLREVYKRDKSTARSLATLPKIKLSSMERLKWPFLQPSIEPLQSALRDAKGTLTLILQVVHLRHAQVTASLDREEQNDLVRMIAAMRRQQLSSLHAETGGYKGLDAGGAEHSDYDSEGSSKSNTALEAWSVIPNTFSDDKFQHFSITPVPVPQQQIAKLPPQDVDVVASMIDSLSPPEQEAIVGGVLDRRLFGPDRCSIRRITTQSWTGSHDLFGKVSGRKFNVIIERKVKTSRSSRTKLRQGPHREERSRVHMRTNSSDSNSPMYDSFSELPQAARPHAFERRREWERREVSVEKKHLEERVFRKEEEKERKGKKTRKEGKWQEEQSKKTSFDREQRTKPHAAHEPSDDEVVKSLLTKYTNFDPGEPLVQGFAAPPPAYDESHVLPQRVPRPY